MSQYSNVISHLLRRYLAFMIDMMVLLIPLALCFICYLFIPIPYFTYNKNVLETLAALVNFLTGGMYDIIVELVKFIIKLFVEHVNSWSMFWNEFTQLIQRIITNLITTLVEYIILPVIFIPWRAWAESSSKQASIGKRIVGLKVVNQLTGGRVGFLNSLVRNIILLFGGTFSAPFILFTKRKQALSDIIAGAVVIETDTVKNPILAVLLSLFFFGGGGQIYNGQVAKGITLIILTWLLQPIFIGYFVLLIGCIDAAAMAEKLQKGETIGQWQFFWSKNSESERKQLP